MSNIEVVQDTIPVEAAVSSIPIEVDASGINIGILEADTTCEAIVEIIPVEPSTSEIAFEVDSIGGDFTADIASIIFDSFVERLEIIEACKQGPAGPTGPPGSGGSDLTEQVLSGEDKLIYSLPLSLYNAVNFKLSILDLVNVYQVYKDIKYTFFTSRVKCSVQGISGKDPVNHKFTYVKTATDFEVYLKNNMPNTLLIKGLVFPM